MRPTTPDEVMEALAAPFEPDEVKWKAQSVKGERALAVAYVDARVIQDRLDDVLGIDGWEDNYEFLPDGSCTCRLRLRIGEVWVQKMDVGSPSEQPDEHDRVKASVSDALKRAAVKFGLGRYLYRLPSVWTDYDPQRRNLRTPPALPAWALPKGAKPAPVQAPAAIKKPAAQLPRDGKELLGRLQAYERKLVAEGACKQGDLLKEIAEEGAREHGLSAVISEWAMVGIQFATDFVREYESRRKAG